MSDTSSHTEIFKHLLLWTTWPMQ